MVNQVNTTPYLFPQIPQNSVASWDNVFSEQELLQVIALADCNGEQAKIVGQTALESSKDRITNIVWIPFNENTRFIWDRIATVIFQLNASYFNFSLTGIHEDIQLGIYDSSEGGHYDWHIDSIPSGTTRKLSLAMLLNDEFEGGQLQVKIANDEPHNLDIKKNRAWVFPSTFLHRVAPVTKGIRKSLVVWAGGPAFR